ncbi:MAG: hypothetical protein AAF961_00360 [Planctomycetota bacterium]
MDRIVGPMIARTAVALLPLVCLSATGCVHTLLATGVYLWQGGNVVPAECEDLEDQRVVVVCRPPASHEYRFAGAARSIGRSVSGNLAEHVPGIDVVSPREVDNWIDEQDWENFKDLGRSVKATRVVYIELDDFELYKGKTLYQGNADVNVSVFDITDRGKLLWDRRLGQLLFPQNSGIPAADKPVQHFQRQFVEVVSRQIAEHFYKHDPNRSFAMDSVANE